MPRPKEDKSLFSNQDGVYHDVPVYDPSQQQQPFMIDPNDPNIPQAANWWPISGQPHGMGMGVYPAGGIGQLAYQNPILPAMPPQQQAPPPPQAPAPPPMAQYYQQPPAYPQMPYQQQPPMYPAPPPMNMGYPTPVPQFYPVPYQTPQVVPQPYPVYVPIKRRKGRRSGRLEDDYSPRRHRSQSKRK